MNIKKRPYGDYQEIIDLLRMHEDSGCGNHWPGDPVGSPAHSRYPNIAAEILAAQYFLWVPAEHAFITEELLAAVIEAGEGLETGELLDLSHLFGCSICYLASPVFSLVNPESHKGKARKYDFDNLLHSANFSRSRYPYSVSVIKAAYEHGRAFPYAFYRQGCRELENSIQEVLRLSRRTRSLQHAEREAAV